MIDSNAQKNPSKNMDYMDIDQVMDVPDSPDRFAAQSINQGVTNPPREKGKLVIGNGNIRSLSFRPHANIGISDESEGQRDGISVSALGNSSSSRNGHLFRRLVGEKADKYENKHSIHSQDRREKKALSTSQSSSCGEDTDLPYRALENSQAREIIKGSLSTNGFPNSSKISSSTVKGKEKIDYTCKGRSGFDNGKESDFVGDSHPKTGNTTLNSMTTSRVSGQKRLVRNGCISPLNIAKAKHGAEKHNTLSVDAVQNDVGTMASNALDNVDIRELVAEENGFPGVKGKGVLIHPFSSKDPDTKTIDLSSRSSTTGNGKANRTGDSSRDAVGCFEGFGGWRSTRNRTKKLNIPLSDENSHLSMRKDDTSQAIPQLDRVYEPRLVADAFIKRQRQGSSVDNPVECSTPRFDNSGIVVRDSSGESSTSRSIRNQRRLRLDISHPVIEIDEFSPQTRPRVSDNIGFSSNDDLDARVRQLEADEMLARELQEQLYNEVPGVGVGEIDAQVAFSLQNEENSHHAFSGGSHIVSRPRGSSVSNLYRQSLSRSSHNPSTRRGTQARVPTSTRMARLRSRPPSIPRMLSSGQPLFPSNMDVDMRIHILEALEAFSDMGVAGNFLQGQPDFNENDYEMLLALDENNHHVGASVHQINGLPQSTVQTDNFEEACAICLETPSIGDTIRHLPCLHKFHKDCIDQWLGRSTSCPVCKSSIT